MTKRIYFLSDHFKECSLYYFFVGLFAAIGLGIGLYISFTGYRYTALLTSADKNMFDFITGNASYTSIFYSRLVDILLCFFIVVLLSLSRFSSIFGYLFLAYQMSLIVLTCAALITLYGIVGIVNVILFVVPVNLVNFLALSSTLCIGLERDKLRAAFNIGFAQSFKESRYFPKVLLCALLLLAMCFISSFILPIVIKSFVVVSY